MNKIKSLHETVGGLKKEIRTYLDSDTRKGVTDKENDPKLKELETRFNAAQGDLDAELRQKAREDSQVSPFEKLSDGEQRDVESFDWAKCITDLAEGRQQSGIELELCTEGAVEARASGVKAGGICLPSFFAQRRAVGGGYRELRDSKGRRIESRDMTATGGTNLNQGGYTIATEKMGVLDALFNALVLREAGAQILTGLRGNFDWPRLVMGTPAGHKAENVDADEQTLTVTGASFTPHRLPGVIDLSDQLLLQSSSVIEAIVNRNVNEQVTSQVEGFAIEGTGANDQPLGILATTGIGAVAGGTNGAAPDFSDIVNLESKINIANANRGTLHYLTNYKVQAMLKTTPKVSSTDSRMILDDLAGGMLNGYKPLFTNNVAATRTKGSASGVCSSIIFGQFSDLVIGFWSGLNLEVVRDRAGAIAGKRSLVFNVYGDSNVIRPASFAAMKDALTTAFN